MACDGHRSIYISSGQDFEVIGSQKPSDACTNPDCRSRIKQLEEELKRLKSVGYDVLKQRGTWQAVGRQPAESSLDFNNIFDHEVNDLAKSLENDCGQEEDSARELACAHFQSIYKGMREVIWCKVLRTLSKVFTLGSEDDSDEQLFDITRAYGLLLNASGIMNNPVHEELKAKKIVTIKEDFPQVRMEAVQSFTSKSTSISWNMLTTIPPLLSVTPPSSYFKEWHEKELAPVWDKDLPFYDLLYYRPVLFMSCEGKVARKAWVGNKVSATCSTSLGDCVNQRDQAASTVCDTNYSEEQCSNTKQTSQSTIRDDIEREVCNACRLPMLCGCTLSSWIDNTIIKPWSRVRVIQPRPSPQPAAQDDVIEQGEKSKYFQQKEMKKPQKTKKGGSIQAMNWMFKRF